MNPGAVSNPGAQPSGGSLTYLVVSTAITAHTLNAGKLVAGLVADGHRVLWYADERFADYIRRCGAEHWSPSSKQGLELAWDTGRGELRRVRRLYRDMVARVPAQLDDLRHRIDGERIDAVLSDTLIPAAGILAFEAGAPWATFGDGPLLWWDEDTPPFGTGLPPMRGKAGRHRNRHVQRVIDGWIFRQALERLNELRTEVGAHPAPNWRSVAMSERLHLQGCSPRFEYPRAALPPNVHFIGALGPAVPLGDPMPEDLLRDARPRPLALLTQGTMRPDLRELVLPGAQALVAEGFDVLVAGTADGGWNRWPSRVHAMQRVDYDDALRETDLIVTNGGYTTVTLAIEAGVPIVQAGNSEEKPDIGARIAWSGVGAALRTRRPPVWRLRRAIRRVMGSPRRRVASERLSRESRQLDAAAIGAGLLVDLANEARRA